MDRIFARLAALLMALLLAVPAARAQDGGTNIATRLVSEERAPAAGRTTWLAIEMNPAAGWHGYWENPGDAGIGMTVEWTLPDGVSAGALVYPVPETLLIAGLMNHVYEGRYAVLVPIDLDAGLSPGTRLPIRARADWLACTDEICVPESGTLAADLIVGEPAAPAAGNGDFDGFRQRLPAPLGSPATYAVDGETFRIAIPYPADAPLQAPWFFAREDGVVDYARAQKVYRDGDRLVIETGARGETPKRLTGILRIGDHQGLELTAMAGQVAPGGTLVAGAGEEAGVEGKGAAGNGGNWAALLLVALGGAILGGAILNIMPCVFPILSLKAISLAKAGGDEAQVRRESLSYAGGVIAVCLALGAVMLALRAGGAAVGWAFQLQEPWVVTGLLLLATAIALNLAGLFELGAVTGGGTLAARGGTTGAFWTGALAAFVATPCTGPFMAAAMGSALVLPAPAALLVFAGLGLGLALPFLAIGFVPALRRRLPRPGPWMERFRKLMSVPMFLTALALAWLLGRQGGSDLLLLGVAASLALALLLWWLGSVQRGGGRALWPLAPALAVALGAMLMAPRIAGDATDAAATTEAGMLAAQPFSEAGLAALRDEGKPVFAYFTADWCITCKVNETAAIEREATARAFADAGVAVLRGDWTRRDPAITRFLADHGSAGVPLYLWYAPGSEAKVLPQVLTVETLTELPQAG